MEKQYITLINEDGSETKAEILFTYHSEEFNKNYVVFMPEDTPDEVAAASYIENGTQGTLEQITTEEEWELIADLLEEYVSQLEAKDNGCCCGGECNCDGECDCDGECNGEEECTCGCHKNAN